MKALVIYDSQFGNTAQIAQAVSAGISMAAEATEAVELRQIGETDPDQLAELDLLVVGSPTQKFRPTSATTAFLKRIPKNALQGVRVAAFDTRITEEEIETNRFFSKLVDLFGFAADPISDRLKKKGGDMVMSPEGFDVEGTEGPLKAGELGRAKEWGRQIAAQP